MFWIMIMIYDNVLDALNNVDPSYRFMFEMLDGFEYSGYISEIGYEYVSLNGNIRSRGPSHVIPIDEIISIRYSNKIFGGYIYDSIPFLEDDTDLEPLPLDLLKDRMEEDLSGLETTPEIGGSSKCQHR